MENTTSRPEPAARVLLADRDVEVGDARQFGGQLGQFVVVRSKEGAAADFSTRCSAMAHAMDSPS
jgi:hypothetical protein